VHVETKTPAVRAISLKPILKSHVACSESLNNSPDFMIVVIIF
jgi:hypothetical protein